MRTWLLAGLCVLTSGICVAQEPDFVATSVQFLGDIETLWNYDADGYGQLAWNTAYGMMALNALYEATGDVHYLERQAVVAEEVLKHRDSDLAATRGEGPYVDYQRGRVLKAWGTGYYSKKQHTCWLVHTGQLVYPIADFVRLVHQGGEATSALLPRADAMVPLLETAVHEFDDEWHESQSRGIGYYLWPNGTICPNNQMNAVGCALFLLGDVTGKAEYTDKARKMAVFFGSKLTHVADGDYYVWAYTQKTSDGPPGTGEDISHASINVNFAYVAWQHGATFDDRDMMRLANTVTRCIDLGNGNVATNLDRTGNDLTITCQIGRWGMLARFDPAVEKVVLDYAKAHPGPGESFKTTGALHDFTGALGYAFLARARAERSR